MTSLSGIYQLPHDESWEKAIRLLSSKAAKSPNDVEVALDYVFLLWYVLLEVRREAVQRPSADIENELREAFNTTRGRFQNAPRFLFVVGYIVLLSPWHFTDSDIDSAEQYAKEMLTRAKRLKSEALYQWGYEMAVTKDSEAAHNLASKMVERDANLHAVDNLGLAAEYFREVIGSSAGESTQR